MGDNLSQQFTVLNGSAEASDGGADATIIAAQGANTTVRLLKAVVMVRVAAAGGGGEVAIEDGVGGTRIFVADADVTGVHNVDFGDFGFPLTTNTLLNVTVDGAATTEATARVSAVALST